MDRSVSDGGEFGAMEPRSEPTIYVFSGMRDGGDGICYAMAEDGTVLGSHWCSSEGRAVHDLGVQEGARPDRHETYAKHYPAGYKMEFVPAREIECHAGLQRAMRLIARTARPAPT